MPPNQTTNSVVPTAAGRPKAIVEAQINTVNAMNAKVNAPRNRWIRFSMINIRALRTSLSMRVKARNVTARRPVMVPKNARKPTTTQRSAMAGRTLGFALPVSGRYIYRFECSLLSVTSAVAELRDSASADPDPSELLAVGDRRRSSRARAAYRISGKKQRLPFRDCLNFDT